MKRLIIWLALLLPFFANAQVNGTIQKTSATGTIRGSFGSLGLDTLPRVTGALVNGYILKYHAATNKWYASPDGYIAGLQDSLTKKANRTFDNVASGAIAKAKADTSANGLLPKSNLFPLGDTRWAKSVTVQDSLNTRVKKSGDTMTGTLNGTDIVLSDNIKATGLNSTGQATLGSLNQGGKMNFVSGGTGAVGGTLGFSTNATTNILSLQNIQGLELTSTNSNGYVGVRATGSNGAINFRTGSNINGYVHPSGNWSFQNGGTYTDNGYRIDVNGTGRFTSTLTSNSFVKSGGTGSQFLMGNGTVRDTTTIQTVSNFFPKGDTRYQTLANLSTDLTASATKYPSVNAVNTGLATKIGASFLSATSPIFYNSGTGVISSQAAGAAQEGYVTTGTQTFAGIKTFTSSPVIAGGSALQIESGSTGNYTFLQAPVGLGASNTITFPSSSGTVALTSQLSGYLPLTGGTLTGPLNGTTSTMSGKISWGTGSYSAGVSSLWNQADNGTLLLPKAGSTNDFTHLTAAGGILWQNPTGTNNAVFEGSLKAKNIIYSTSAVTEASGYQLNSITMGYSTTGTYGWITAGGAAARTALALNANGGNVGIGTTSPLYKTVIQTANNTTGLVITTNANDNETGLYINPDHTNGLIKFFASGNSDKGYAFNTGDTERMRITSGGNVGIGTTSPNSTTNYTSLDIAGTNGGMSYYSTESGWKGRIYGNDGGLTLETNGALPLYLTTNGTPALTIAPSGTSTFSSLAGSGTRMVVADPSGVLSTQAIPSGGGGGSVTGVAVATANGLSGTSDGAAVVPTLTLSTTVSGMVKANGSAFSAAVAGTDYTTPSSTETFTNKSGNISQWTNNSGYITSSALSPYAPLNSPTFTGTVSGITAAMVGAPSGSGTSTGTNTGDQTNISGNAGTATLAANSTQWNGNTIDKSVAYTSGIYYLSGWDYGVSSTTQRLYTATAVQSFLGLGSNAYTSTTYAPLNSPGLTGTPTAPTPSAGDNSNKLATTEFIANAAGRVLLRSTTTFSGTGLGSSQDYNTGIASGSLLLLTAGSSDAAGAGYYVAKNPGCGGLCDEWHIIFPNGAPIGTSNITFYYVVLQ